MNVLRLIVEWDATVRTWLTTHHSPIADVLMAGLSTIGRGSAIWIAITLSLLLLKRIRPRGMATVFIGLALAFTLTDLVIKPLVARARPFDKGGAVRVIDQRPPTYSFPSGHAASSFAAAATLSKVWPPGRLVFWPLATLIALSRIYVGVHYPLDVIGGAALGLTCAWGARRLLPVTST